MKDAKGKIKVDTVFNSTLKPGEKSVQIAFPLGTMVQPISVPVQVENSKEDGTKQDTNKQAQDPVAKPVTDNPSKIQQLKLLLIIRNKTQRLKLLPIIRTKPSN